MLGGEDDALLFARINAGSGTAETAAAALTNLCKDQGLSIAQDEVDLAETATVVGCDQFQSLPLQIQGSGLFGAGAGLGQRHLLSMTIPCPWRMMARTPSRWNTCPYKVSLPVTPSNGIALFGLRP